MSDCAYLIAGKTPEPAGVNGDGESNYETRTGVIADGGKYQMPLFWLSLFSGSDLCFFEFGDEFGEYRVPTVVCERSSAFTNLRKRRGLISETFPACASHWNSWEYMVGSSPALHFKIDAGELWDLGREEFERDFPAALRWFESGSEEDFEILLSMAALQYDPETRHLTLGGGEVLGEHLYGYRFPAPPKPPPLPPPMPR